MRNLGTIFLIGISGCLLGACGGGSSPANTSITVTGKLLDPSGQPGGFLPVLVGGKVTSSDATGTFTMNDVTSPYQLVVLQPAAKYARIYEGVSRKDPIVIVSPVTSPAPKHATLTVSFSGTGSGTGLMDVSNPVNVNLGVGGSVATPGTSYSTDFQWTGPSAFEGNICAILYASTNNVATAITAFGERDRVLFQDGQTTTEGVDMAAVPTKTISGTVTVPAGFTVNAKTLGFVCGNASRPSYPFTFDTSSGTNFSYVTPVTSNVLHMSANGTKGDSSIYVQQIGVAPDASGVTLALPQPIEQVSPANNSVGVSTSASLSWSPTTVGLSQVTVAPLNPGPLSMTIYTASSNVTLPDLSALGYPPAKGVAYDWYVNTDSTLKTLDDALSGVPRDFLKSYSGSFSGDWQFTTAP